MMMNVPGFTAEFSPRRSSAYYQADAMLAGLKQCGEVIPKQYAYRLMTRLFVVARGGFATVVVVGASAFSRGSPSRMC